MTDGLARLYALRSHLDLIIRSVEDELRSLTSVEPGSCPACHAPPDHQVPMDTVDGTKRRHCSDCGAEWTP